MIIGHSKVVESLQADLPRVTLLHGPEGVGKRTLALLLSETWLPRYQVRTYFDGFTSDDVAGIKLLCEIDDDRLFIIDISKASNAVLNDMLKLLEETRSQVTFILITSKTPLPTIYSRSAYFYMGRLSQEELFEILVQKCNMSENSARDVCGEGTTVAALKKHFAGSQRGVLFSVLTAIETGHRELFNQAFKSMEEETVELLHAGLYEAATESWDFFEEGQLGKFFSEPYIARLVLRAFGEQENPSSVLAARIVLEPWIGRFK